MNAVVTPVLYHILSLFVIFCLESFKFATKVLNHNTDIYLKKQILDRLLFFPSW